MTEMFTPSAKIVKDSESPLGYRLVTMEVTFHRFILAEMNTHRAFSRSSASSRAIPYAKMREKALTGTAFPVEWPSEKRGMQGGEEVEYPGACRVAWQDAAGTAVEVADRLHDEGVHKSVINRLLEPFLPHTAIITATDWDNFFRQRCHPDAQPEMRMAAEAMKEAFDSSEPTPVGIDGWHIPYVDTEVDAPLAADYVGTLGGGVNHIRVAQTLLQVSVARCARVSYLTHDGVRDISKDVELYDRLRGHSPPHASPFEHVATPSATAAAPGNFRGWVQLRAIQGMS